MKNRISIGDAIETDTQFRAAEAQQALADAALPPTSQPAPDTGYATVIIPLELLPATIPLAKLTPAGSAGSITIAANGQVSYTLPT